MKIRLFSLCLLLTQLFFAQNIWETINPKPSSGNNKAVVFSGGTGFIINDAKELIATNDNGETWVVKQAVTSANAISFSSNIGYIVGDNGYVLQTIDSGATWSQVNIGSSEKLNSVSVFADKVLITSDKKLFTSTDGINFTSKLIDVPNPWVLKSIFTTSTEGYICSYGFIYKTTDSGTTWTQKLAFSGSPTDLNLLYFKNANEGYISFSFSEFKKTNDGGETWTNVPGNWLYAIKSMYFTDQNTGFAVGTYGNIYKTTDNGLTWIKHPENFFGNSEKDLTGVHFLNSNQGFAVGKNGIILQTNDSGASWRKNSFTYDNVNEIQKVDDFYYVQGGDHLYKSPNLKTWQKLTSPELTDNYIMDFQMVTPSIAYSVVGNAGSSNIFKSIDGAQSWNLLANTYGGDYDIYFLNENLGFRSGSNLYKTTDGGIIWTKITTPNSSNVRFLNENVGFALTSAQLFKTNDGGMTWSVVSNLNEYVYNYQFLNENDGFILSNYAILKTKDGGLTWEKIPTSKSYQYVNFQTENIGYLSGQYSDDHSYTDNGGATWTSISKPFSDIRRNVINNQLFLGGINGKIAATKISFNNAYLQNKYLAGITAQSATVVGYGSVNNGDLENVLFEYSTDASFANILSVSSNIATVLGNQNANLSATLNQLTPATTYFVRIKATNAGSVL